MPPLSYPAFVERLKREQGADRALEAAIGRYFDPVGVILRAFLVQNGLLASHDLVDVGCGAGRLAKHLASYLTGRYLGTDVVPDLVDHAREIAGRADWRFETVRDVAIPERDAAADFVCFFSVFTHLSATDSFRYLAEAARVARPGGRIVFTFLEFAVDRHWQYFEAALDPERAEAAPAIAFHSRDAIEAWAAHLPVTIEKFHAGDEAHVELPHAVVFPDGPTFEHRATLGPVGQSVCILRRR
jgi:SAM-dependent methyltransferase